MKRNFYFQMVVMALGIMSCSEKIDKGTPTPIENQDKELIINIRTDSPITRAFNSSTTPIDDGLKRIDLYIYHKDNPERDHHMTIEPNPSGITTIKILGQQGEGVGVLAFGNLDKDTAEYLKGKTLTQMYNSKTAEAWIVWSANNFNTDRIVMVGSNYHLFDEDGTKDIELRRIMYRIDIGKIIIDSDSQSLIGKKVYVKSIALTNIVNYFVPLRVPSINTFDSWMLFFLKEGALTNAFGGIEEGFKFFINSPTGWNTDGSFSIQGPGILNGEFPFMVNPNYKKGANILNISANGILKEATFQGYDNSRGEGLVSSAVSKNTPAVLEVDKSFYGYIGRGAMSTFDVISDYTNQNFYPKLVIELSIDGESWFYPIQINYAQPNVVYRIDKIIIRDYGSEYSNFSPVKYAVSAQIKVKEWTDIDIENIETGIH